MPVKLPTSFNKSFYFCIKMHRIFVKREMINVNVVGAMQRLCVCQCIIKIYYIETAHYHVDWTYSVKQRIKIPNCAVILSFSSLSLSLPPCI